MMNEWRTTLAWCAAAAAAALTAWAVAPDATVPRAFADRGELFFPAFSDANAALSLEVIEFDPVGGSARPFKVLNRDGRWIIPSHFGHPADAEDGLSRIAATLITLRRDDFTTDRPADHARFGVLDPLDPSSGGLGGRGTRVTVRGRNERILADIIVGREARPGYRHVRLPGSRRVYAARLGELDISTEFADWIERDVLQATREDIDEIVIRNYSVDEQSRALDARDTLRLRRVDDRWTMDGLRSGERLNQAAVNGLLSRLLDLRIAAVLPKPPGISAMLARTAAESRIASHDVEDLARKGFYLSQTGELLSNEGEMIVHTTGGIFYTLRFGEVAPGDTPLPAESAAQQGHVEPQENRYLFIMAAYDPSSATAPGRDQTALAAKARLLQTRFAPWYYVISASAFATLRPGRADLTGG